MKSSLLQRTKITFAVLALLSLVTSTAPLKAACENTDKVTEYIKTHGTHEVQAHYQAVYEKITNELRNFVYNTSDGKKVGHYAEELRKLSKELEHVAHQAHGDVHKRLMRLCKDFKRFIAILKANQNGYAIALLMQLNDQEELMSLVPSELGWSKAVVSDAVMRRYAIK